jgi:hypothetical protein
MTMPGFTAQASAYATRNRYRSFGRDLEWSRTANLRAAATLATPFAWRGAFDTRWRLTFMIC